MATKVYNNVEGQRILNNGMVVEDVTSVTVPDVRHTTSTVSTSGMVADVEMPNMNRYEAMELSIAHNNGVNSKYLPQPGKHNIEVRVVRQRYNVAVGEIEYESVKFRFIGIFKEVTKGSIETGNPYGSTCKFSVLRYEEEMSGEIITVIDAMAGVIRFNGIDYSSVIESMLN